MGVVKKIETNDRAAKKIRLCREAGMEIRQDFLAGTAEIRNEGKLVLRCVRVTDSTWQMEYNDDFWEEKDRDADKGGTPS
jgi:hypothetical protein